MFLLDTNVISELRKPKPHGAVLAWIKPIEDAQLFLSAVTLAEIQAGIEITREKDQLKAKEIEAWLEEISDSYNIIPMGGIEFRCWAKLMHHKSDELYEDAMIAATAIAHHLIVVTRNVNDFAPFKVPILNPFEN
jgi:toxin FitB